jgi:DNA-binding transcriptional regulator YiaG
MTTTDKPVAFARVDSLRKHMLLSKTHMARLLGVSRVTYYNWDRMGILPTRGGTYTRKAIKELLRILVEEEWPSPRVIAMTSDERFEELQKLVRIV